MTAYRAAFFDLDGTLLDTARDLVPAVIATVQAAGFTPPDAGSIRGAISAGSRGMLACAMQTSVDDPRVEALVPDFHRRYAASTGENSDFFAGLPEILDKLEAAGTPWGIVTNKHLRFAEAIARRRGFDRRAAVLVGGDTLPQIKPHPAPLLYACAAVNTAPRHCLYIGDSPFDIAAAKNAGMPSCAVRWGYTPPDDAPENWHADFTISTATELHDILWKKPS